MPSGLTSGSFFTLRAIISRSASSSEIGPTLTTSSARGVIRSATSDSGPTNLMSRSVSRPVRRRASSTTVSVPTPVRAMMRTASLTRLLAAIECGSAMVPCCRRLTAATSRICGSISPARKPRSIPVHPPPRHDRHRGAVTIMFAGDRTLDGRISVKRVDSPRVGAGWEHAALGRQEIVEGTPRRRIEQVHLSSTWSCATRRGCETGRLAWHRERGLSPRVTVPHMRAYAVVTTASNQPGILSGVTKVLADRHANISHVDIIEHGDRVAELYLEFSVDADIEPIVRELGQVSGVTQVALTPSFSKIYGKRIIIMGGGAQVGQVALGAITEADRHNIRGERISVDTIPLVGESELASAVRAVVRLPRVRLLVLAGSLMGGDISKAVQEVRQKGLIVISLNMAGSVPDVADLVVSDPVQAGVMAVMAIADTATFDIVRQQKRKY